MSHKLQIDCSSRVCWEGLMSCSSVQAAGPLSTLSGLDGNMAVRRYFHGQRRNPKHRALPRKALVLVFTNTRHADTTIII